MAKTKKAGRKQCLQCLIRTRVLFERIRYVAIVFPKNVCGHSVFLQSVLRQRFIFKRPLLTDITHSAPVLKKRPCHHKILG